MAQKGILVFLLCVVALCAAQKDMWSQKGRADGNELVHVRLALPQSNLDVLESTLLDAADPHSTNYGKWWTLERIQNLVAPPKSVTEGVLTHLASLGLTTIVNHRDSIKLTASVAQIEELFSARLHYFQHLTEGAFIIRAVGGYTIPAELKNSVELVTGLLEFPQYRKHAVKKVEAGAGGYVVPALINNLYGIPTDFSVNSSSSLCLAEFQADLSFLQSDLANFTTGNAIPPINVTKIVGPFNGTDVESSLDVQFGGATGQTTPIWYWTEDEWMYEFAVDLIGTPNPPLVVSMSWGWPEPDQCQIDSCPSETSAEYVARTNIEFQKAGLMGITLLAASGDQGAPGDGDYACSIFKKDKLSTIFPGASPWVLSVGATMLDGATSGNFPLPPICKEVNCTTWTSEEVCTFPEALITTGGGFSNYVPTPSYQEDVVKAYLSSSVELPPSKYFNQSNRGFPDVSALGHMYLIIMDGQWFQVDGTSCSTPVWGGIISLLNSYRLNHGKSSLGFVIPLIYQAYAQDATTFTDITSGNNKCTERCCDKYGYLATKGWDPVTGLGTPVFPKLLKYVASLP